MITFHFKTTEEADSFSEFLDNLRDNPDFDFDEFFGDGDMYIEEIYNAEKQS